ncbi:MAG: LuxR C-terminal-related transcriptional regulator, partial [Microbacterium sp.]
VRNLVGRDAVVRSVADAVERARAAGGGVVLASGPAGVGTTAVVEESLRPLGREASWASAAVPPDPQAGVWWIDDAQRLLEPALEHLRSEVASSRVVVLSGRAPLGPRLVLLLRSAVRADPRSVIDIEPLAPEQAALTLADAGTGGSRIETDRAFEEAGESLRSTADLARACGSRLRVLSAATHAGGDLRASSLRIAVEDLVTDLSPAARGLLEIIAVGGPRPPVAAVDGVWHQMTADSAARPRSLPVVDARPATEKFDSALAGLVGAGFVVEEGGRLTPLVPVVCDVLARHLVGRRVAETHVAFVEVLVGLAGVDPREAAEHVRKVAHRLPPKLSIEVLTASAERRMAASDAVGAAKDLETVATLAEVAAESGGDGPRTVAFDALFALGTAQYYAGELERAEAAFRRAERFHDDGSSAKLAEIALYRAHRRVGFGLAAELPAAITDLREGAGEHPAEIEVMRLFLADRGDDAPGLDTVCARLIALDGDGAPATDRGAAALGRSVRASTAGDLALAMTEAERGFAIAGDDSAIVYGAIQSELVRLCCLLGDLEAAQRHADGDSFSLSGRIPLMVEASLTVQGASVALLRGDIGDASERAERALVSARLAPVPRTLVRCGAWVAILSAMRGDLPRARSLIAEAGRIHPRDGRLRINAVVQLARVQLALRESGPLPPPFDLRLERPEGPSRLLLPTLLARLALVHGDTATAESAVAELDRLRGSPPAAALARRLHALVLVPTRLRHQATAMLEDSATELEQLGFAGLAAETRLEWAELAAERTDAAARAAVVELVPFFDAQGLDDWGDRARRLARTIGVRIGGRRGGSGELTRRETEVVDLVVTGLSNAEIARRLYLSERTVETHLQHVYRRLGVDSRLSLITRLSAGGDGENAP